MSKREDSPYVFSQDDQISSWGKHLQNMEKGICIVNIITVAISAIMCFFLLFRNPTSLKSLFSVLVGLVSVKALFVVLAVFVFVWFTSVCVILILRNTALCHYRTAWMLNESYKYKVFMEISFRTYHREFMMIDSQMSSNIRSLSVCFGQTIGGKDRDVVRELSNALRGNEKLAEMIVEKLADDPSKRMFE